MRCPSGKQSYPSASVARSAIARIVNGPNAARHRETRTYRCPSCGAWHLTHLPAERGAAKRSRRLEERARRREAD